MNQEDQRYLDSLTKEELIQERAINQSLILASQAIFPITQLPSLPQQEKEEYIKENLRLIDKRNYIRRLLNPSNQDPAPKTKQKPLK